MKIKPRVIKEKWPKNLEEIMDDIIKFDNFNLIRLANEFYDTCISLLKEYKTYRPFFSHKSEVLFKPEKPEGYLRGIYFERDNRKSLMQDRAGGVIFTPDKTDEFAITRIAGGKFVIDDSYNNTGLETFFHYNSLSECLNAITKKHPILYERISYDSKGKVIYSFSKDLTKKGNMFTK